MYIPHCPNPACRWFHEPPAEKWYIHYGYHHTKAFGRVHRFRCKRCGRTFSTQTFLIDYYAKKVVDYEILLQHLVTASGLLDLSRKLRVRVETIENRFERFARCALAIHADLLERLPMNEDMTADGLETFSYSQYYPCHVNIVAGSLSEFIYTHGFANLRRKGRMTKEQKQKRQRLEANGRADPKSVERSFIRLLGDLTQRLLEKGITKRKLYTDEHTAYPRAFGKVEGFSQIFVHQRVNSKEPRTKQNPLFPVNYIDRQIRKDMSDHTRETVQWAKCPSALMARMSIYRFYHNCVIPRRVRESRSGNDQSHAEKAGILKEELDAIISRHWLKRCFLTKLHLGYEEVNTWLCRWRNPGISFGRYIPHYIQV